MEMDNSSSDDSSSDAFSCCEDQTLLFDGQDLVKVVKDQVAFAQPDIHLNGYYVYSPYTITSPNLIPLPDYRPPPLIVKDIHVFHEVYLI